MGLDPANNLASIARFVRFTVDGPSQISGEVSNATGGVRVCRWRGNQVENQQCQNFTNGNGTLSATTNSAGSSTWTYTLIGLGGASPTVDFTVGFNATSPAVDLENFRFQPQLGAPYNGVTAVVDPSDSGQLQIDGTIDPEPTQYRVVISTEGAGAVEEEEGGPSESFSVSHDVTTDNLYMVQASNPSDGEESGPRFLAATISWT
jgi:hypothetical protein